MTLRIVITDPETVQLLTMYTKDIQNVLVEKAVADFFERNGSREIVKVLLDKGIKLGRQPRKRTKRGGNGQDDGRNSRDGQQSRGPASAQKVGFFSPK